MNQEEVRQGLREGKDPLELSIQKWQDIVDDKGKDEGRVNCALCLAYDDDCTKCPANIKGDCHANTPYGKYYSAENKRWLKYWAKKELEFLKSLRKPLEAQQ